MRFIFLWLKLLIPFFIIFSFQLPDNIEDLVKQECIEAMSVDDNEEEGVLPSKEENTIREHICVRSYLVWYNFN